MLSLNLSLMRQIVFEFLHKKRGPHKYTQDQRDEWVDLYKLGRSFREIANEAGGHYSTVSWYVSKVLCLTDGRKTGRKKIHLGLTDKQVINNARLLREYGISLAERDAILESQGGVCAICRLPPKRGKTSSSELHVDHDHLTGRIRGMLCLKCNPALGQFSDSSALLRAAADYLDFHSSKQAALKAA